MDIHGRGAVILRNSFQLIEMARDHVREEQGCDWGEPRMCCMCADEEVCLGGQCDEWIRRNSPDGKIALAMGEETR